MHTTSFFLCCLSLLGTHLVADTYRPGLLQGKSNQANDWSFTLEESVLLPERTLGAVMADTFADGGSWDQPEGQYTNPLTGNTFAWNKENSTFAYWGEIYLQGGVPYTFGKSLDDGGFISINGQPILDNTTYNSMATGVYIPPATGWYPIEIRAGDGTGEKGPYGSWKPDMGLGYNTTGYTEREPKSRWTKFAVDGNDLSFLRVKMDDDEPLQVDGVSSSSGMYTFMVRIPDGTGTVTVYLNGTETSIDLLSSWAIVSDPVAIAEGGGTVSITVPWTEPSKPFYAMRATGIDHKGAFETIIAPTSLSGLVVKSIQTDVRLATIDSANLTGSLVAMGDDGATSCELRLYYAPVGGSLSTEPQVSIPSAATGPFYMPLTSLQWNTTYAWTLVVENNLGEFTSFSGTFFVPAESMGTIPGLLQGQMKISNNTPPDFDLRMGDINPALVDNTLGVLMGRPEADADNSDDGRNKMVSDPNSRTSWGWTDDYLAYYYEGRIFLQGGVPFYVVSKFDDGGACYIHDVNVFNQWTKTGATGYNDGGSYTVGVYTPETTGWYDFRAYLWDWSGGKKRMWGVSGLQWTTEPSAIRYEGATPVAVQSFVSNSTIWHPFYDDGSGSFLCIGTAALSIGYSVIENDSLTATVDIPLLGPATLYAWTSVSYGGDDPANWTSALLQEVEGTGEESILVQLPIPTGTKYVRFAAINDSGMSLSETLVCANVSGVSVTPEITLSPIETTSSTSATVPVAVHSFGAGASSMDLYAVYGLLPDSLLYTQKISTAVSALGRATAMVNGLLPERTYYVKVLADNGNEDGISLSGVQSFQTKSLEDTIRSCPGLFQAVFTGGEMNTTSLPSETTGAEVVPGAMMASVGTSDNGQDPFTSYTSPSGREYIIHERETYAYEGYMFMEAGVPYRFAKHYDDWGYVAVDGQMLISSTSHNEEAYASYTPETTGWHSVDFRVGNNTSGGGIRGGYFGKNYIGAGLAYTTGEGNVRVDKSNWSLWKPLTNTVDNVFLRNRPAVREIEIATWSITGGVLTVQLDVAEDNEARNLYAVYGETYGGDDPAEWTHGELLGSIPADVTRTDSAGDVTGIGAGILFARFYFDCGDAGLSWSEPLVFADPNAPVLDDIVVESVRGDGALVRSVLVATGGSDCMVTAEVSTSPTFEDSVIWPVEELQTPGDVEVDLFTEDPASPFYIEPGATYYVRFRAINEDARVDVSKTASFTTPAASTMGDVSIASSLWTVTVRGTLTKQGAGDTTTVTLLTGPSEDNLTPQDTLELSAPGVFSFSFEVEEYGTPVYCMVVSSNACDTAFWVSDSKIVNVTPVDAATYYWKGDVAEGDWDDPDNWETDPVDSRLTFPNARTCFVNFRNRGADSATTVNVKSAYSCIAFTFGNPNMTITLKGTDAETSLVTAHGYIEPQSLVTQNGCRFVIDSSSFVSGDGYRAVNESCLVVTNAGTFNSNRDIWMHGDYGRIELYGRSSLNVWNYSIQMSSPHNSILVDDSTLVIHRRYLELAQKSDTLSSSIEFRGKNPVLRCLSVTSGGLSAGCVPEIIFNLPVGGYTEAPIQRLNDDARPFMGASDNWPKQHVRLVVAKDSPFFQEGSTKTMPLVDWKDGIQTERIILDEQPRVDQTTIRYRVADGADENALPIGIEVTAVGENRTLILFR